MTSLPQYLRRLPFVFYALAILFGGWRFYNDWMMASSTFQYAETQDELNSLAKSTALYWGMVEATYIIASGAMIHVLIAIYDKVEGK